MSRHFCAMPDCQVDVAPEKLFCLGHWRMLSRSLRERILPYIMRGPCDPIATAPAYLEHEAILYIQDREARLVLMGRAS